jgi:hypothetical protein
MLRQQLIEAAYPTKIAAFRNDLTGIEMAGLAVKRASEALRSAAGFYVSVQGPNIFTGGTSASGVAKNAAHERSFMERVRQQVTKTKPGPSTADPNDFDALVAKMRRRVG